MDKRTPPADMTPEEAGAYQFFMDHAADDRSDVMAFVLMGYINRRQDSPSPIATIAAPPMNDETRKAFEWAMKQDFPSVSARMAKTLARYINLVLRYSQPNENNNEDKS